MLCLTLFNVLCLVPSTLYHEYSVLHSRQSFHLFKRNNLSLVNGSYQTVSVSVAYIVALLYPFAPTDPNMSTVIVNDVTDASPRTFVLHSIVTKVAIIIIIQSNLDNSNSDISNYAKLEIKITFWWLSPTIICVGDFFTSANYSKCKLIELVNNSPINFEISRFDCNKYIAGRIFFNMKWLSHIVDITWWCTCEFTYSCEITVWLTRVR